MMSLTLNGSEITIDEVVIDGDWAILKWGDYCRYIPLAEYLAAVS